MTFVFPKNFTWGVATASYQVEGAIHEDGRAPSIWDAFCAVPGAIEDHSSGEVACDEYHRYPEDITLLKELGVNAYRLSIAWPRIVPLADGKVNSKGVEHYIKVLDALRDAGIRPVVTLYHWDLPQYLEDRGGWANRDTALRYGDYVHALAEAFGDRVDTWTTLNEPWCSAYLGYGNGIHAPGVRDYGKALSAVHHLNLAHGLGALAVHDTLGERAKVSVTLNLSACVAQSDSEADRMAKHRNDLLSNEVFLGPMLDGAYDPEIFDVTTDYTDWSFIRDDDLKTIRQPIQCLGINYYSSTHVKGVTDPAECERRRNDHMQAVPAQDIVDALPPEGELTDMGWNQEPRVLTEMLVGLAKRYPGLDLMVTENGSAWKDEVTEDSSAPGGRIIHDPKRVAYLNHHIRAVADAIEAGAPVVGYFAWSLLDNFEWAFGYSKRFGIIGVDYETQERIWKDSAYRYRQIIQEGI